MALEQHRLLHVENEKRPAQAPQTSREAPSRPAARDDGEPEAEDAALGLCWEPNQGPSVAVVVHHVGWIAAVVRFVTLGVEGGMNLGVGAEERVELEIYGEVWCSRREVAAAGRGVGSAAW
jgi:hypothetical protein